MEKTNNSQNWLLVVNGLKNILGLFTSTFLTSHIVSLTPDIMGVGVFNIGLLYIAQYAVFILLYFVLSFFVDRSNRVSLLRIGVLVNCGLLISLVFFGEIIANWILLAGAICGTSEAFYFASYNVLRNEQNRKSNINRYNIQNSVITNIINIVVPTILGLLIDVSSYSNIAMYIVILSIVQLITTFFIKSIKPEGADFEIIGFIKHLKENKKTRDSLKYTYYNALLAGFKSTFGILIVILTIYTFKTNFSLGILTSIFSIVTTILLLMYKKVEDKPKVNKLALLLIVSILPIVTGILFVTIKHTICLILLNLTLTIATQLSEYTSNCDRDSLIKYLDLYDYIAEHQFMFELCLCAIRILAYSVFILVGLMGNFTLFGIMLIVFISTLPIKFICIFHQTKTRQTLELEYANNQNKA